MIAFFISLLTFVVLSYLTALAVQLIRIERAVAELDLFVENRVKKLHSE